MGLLQPARNQTAYAKVGIYGMAGSGKSFTAKNLAIGLSHALGDGKPVAFFDTETGSDFLVDEFKAAGIELLVVKSRAFADLLTFCRECQEEGVSVAIVDSISHVWQELLKAFQIKLRRQYGFEIQDWMKIKPEWQKFSDLYVNAPVHMIVCGRAGVAYEQEWNEDKGKNEMVQAGTKMKAEGEFSFEPSLLVEMLRLSKAVETGDQHQKGWINRAIVIKDRSNRINGQEFDYPTFEAFEPFWRSLNIGGEHLGVDTSRTSVDMLDSPQSAVERKRQVEITLEMIKDTMIEAGLGGTAEVVKVEKVQRLKRAFGTSSWTAIENQKLEDLRFGFDQLRADLIKDGRLAPDEPVEEEPTVAMNTEAVAS